MSKFKVGDRVRITGRNGKLGDHKFDIGQVVVLSSREKFHDDNDLRLIAWRSGEWYIDEEEFVMADSVINTIQLNHQYTSKNGQKWECIAIKDGIAFLSSGGEGDAYRFLLNGENLSQGGGLWDIKWEPVVEWVNTKGSWAKKGEMHPNHYHYNIRFPLIDGKPDFTQANVTPV